MKKFLLLPLSLTGIFCFSQTNDALQFNGTNSYVQVNDNNAIDLSADFTIEAWIYPTGPGSDATQGGMIINKENSYEIARFADGTIQFALSASGAGGWAWTNTGVAAPQDQWSHIALVKSGTSIALFMNGVSVYSDNSQPATLSANSYNLRFGTRSIGTLTYFNGNLDEIRIWNTARTQAQIKANMFNRNLSNGASGLVAYYRMNEGSGTTAANSCTNTSGIDGTLTNGPTWVASPIQFAGNALSFDGTNDYVSVPYNNTLDLTTDITIEAWVYATKNTGIQNVVSKSSNTANNGYIFPRTDDGWSHVVLYLNIGGWKTLSAPYPSLNAWHHLAATYDGATMKLYIDGTLAASSSQTGSISTNSNALTLGNQTGFSEYFGGTADEIRIWNVAKTQSQIQANMNNELDPTSQTGLVSYYTFNQAIASGTNSGLTKVIDQSGTNNGTLTNFALSGSTSNFLAQNSSITILPLNWLSFTAQKQKGNVLLQWSTSSEINTSDFWIERSVNGKDWNWVGRVLPGDNFANNYSYADYSPARGVNYYRIRQNDKDGKYSYSKAASISFTEDIKILRLIQNPVVNKVLQFEVRASSRQMIRLLNADGKLLWSKELATGGYQVDLSSLPQGVYFLQGGEDSEKLVVQ